MEVTFYKHDNYAALWRKFNAAWTNLNIEIHHSGHKLWKEGADPFDFADTFGDLEKPNEIAFTLTDETSANTAAHLFSDFSGGEAAIRFAGGDSVEGSASLAYCNNPFRLPLNKFNYGEFKRRFTARWTNLSIELFDSAPDVGGLRRGDRELADDFEMKNLKHADRAFLHDYVYIATWGEMLVYVRIAAAIKNNKFGVYCEGNLINAKLKDFNETENLD